jgi:hydrogenase maturation protein HypF
MLGAEARTEGSAWFGEDALGSLLSMLETGLNSPVTTSMGRLFDAVAALTGGPPALRFEGQAAMDLEFALCGAHAEGAYPLPLLDGDPAEADWRPLVEALLEDRGRGASRARMSARFHEAVVEMGVAVARRAGLPRVVLTGGCFQNAYLTERLRERLCEEGFTVFVHRAIPPNDGGIAFGQLLVARRRLEGGGDVSRHTG